MFSTVQRFRVADLRFTSLGFSGFLVRFYEIHCLRALGPGS